MRRREFITLLGGGAAAAWPPAVRAQQPLPVNDAGGFSDLDWPSASNRPILSGSTLTWVGPLGGGPNNGNPVQQSRTLTPRGNGVMSASVEGINFTGGQCTINASNVTLKQCSIYADTPLAILSIANGVDNIVVEDCLIYGPGLSGVNNGGCSAISLAGPKNCLIRRCHVHRGGQHLVHPNWGPVDVGQVLEISDCYMHDVVDRTPEGSHYDVIYFGGGGNGSVVIRHNAMYENLYNQTSVILMESYFGPLKNWTIDNNIMSGGGGTFYCNDAHRGFGAPQNIVLTNNRMGNYRQGFLASINAGGVAVSGNVDINTGVNLDNRI